MASLHNLIDRLDELCAERGHQITAVQWSDITLVIRREFAGERVYVPPADSRKDPARRQAIAEVARKLPTGIAAARLGVSESWVRKIAKKK